MVVTFEYGCVKKFLLTSFFVYIVVIEECKFARHVEAVDKP